MTWNLRTGVILYLTMILSFTLVNARLYVALTFDDGLIEHAAAAEMISSYGLRATFYINSGTISVANGRMSWEDVENIQSSGHEIGGHTINHANLGSLSASERRVEICQDHTNLVNRGFNPRTFCYPFGVTFPNAANRLEECGYSYARDSGGIETPLSCFGCPSAVELPLSQPYDIRSLSYRNSMGPGFLVDQVKAAEKDFETKDGILAFVFHEIRDTNAPEQGILTMDLELFVSWLKANENVSVDSLLNIVEPPPTTTVPTSTTTIGSTGTSTSGGPSTTGGSTAGTTQTTETPGPTQTPVPTTSPLSPTTTPSENPLRTAVIVLGVLFGISVVILLLLFAYRMQELYWKMHPNVQMDPHFQAPPRNSFYVASDDSIEMQFMNNTAPVGEFDAGDVIVDFGDENATTSQYENAIANQFEENVADIEFAASATSSLTPQQTIDISVQFENNSAVLI